MKNGKILWKMISLGVTDDGYREGRREVIEEREDMSAVTQPPPDTKPVSWLARHVQLPNTTDRI